MIIFGIIEKHLVMGREYKAVVKRVYNAETVVLNIDLGFGSWLHHFKVKLKGITALEKRKGDLYKESVDWLTNEILYREVYIESFQGEGDRQGRYEVVIKKDLEKDIAINDKLVKLGYAKVKK